MRFKYRLEGREQAWTDVARRTRRELQQSPARPLSFPRFAFNEDGVPNETGGVLDITVQPQFWQTIVVSRRGNYFC